VQDKRPRGWLTQDFFRTYDLDFGSQARRHVVDVIRANGGIDFFSSRDPNQESSWPDEVPAIHNFLAPIKT
jgi:hypothetical protein